MSSHVTDEEIQSPDFGLEGVSSFMNSGFLLLDAAAVDADLFSGALPISEKGTISGRGTNH